MPFCCPKNVVAPPVLIAEAVAPDNVKAMELPPFVWPVVFTMFVHKPQLLRWFLTEPPLFASAVETAVDRLVSTDILVEASLETAVDRLVVVLVAVDIAALRVETSADTAVLREVSAA